VSRVIYTGAGGFERRPAGQPFTLSPRAQYIERAISCESTADRGIFHTRDESLSKSRYRRVHVIVGESLCSDIATWLKVGTTSLVIALIEAGVTFQDRVGLDEPVHALRAFAGDPDCRVTAEIANSRRRATAIGIQREYLAAAEARCRLSWMPPWTADVCREWRTMLDRLECRDPSLAVTLDWAMKRTLFVASPRGRAGAWTAGQLYELDTKFGRLGEPGIFASLDRRPGTLQHRLARTLSIDDALHSPPATGRARIRGDVIRRFSGTYDSRADWSSIECSGRVLDLSDPFIAQEHWSDDARPECHLEA
jgi:proteasome accessory factor A